MAKLLMITGLGSATDLASGKKGAFYNTLEEFSKYWERIDIIAPKISRDSTSGGFEVESLFGNVFIHISPWPLFFHPLWFLKKGIQIYKEQKFDLMTVHEFPPFYNGIGARLLWSRLFKEKSRILDSRSESGQKIKVPYVLEIFHIPGHPRAAGIKEVIYKFLFKLFIRLDASKAKAVRVMNQKQVPDFLVRAGVPKEKIIYVPAIYVDLDIFKPMDVVKEYDLIFVGRLEPNKGVGLFLEAVKKLNRKSIIVGHGSLYNKIKSEIENHKLNVSIHGFAKDSKEIAELLNKSKILIMSSYNEGGPRVVVEAMACGVPVLATSVGIVPDLLKNSRSGEIIDWEANDIVQKADGLLNDPEMYQRYSLSGPEIAKQFEQKEAIENYANKIKKLI